MHRDLLQHARHSLFLSFLLLNCRASCLSFEVFWQVKDVLSKLQPPAVPEQLQAAQDGIDRGNWTIEQLEMGVVANTLGIVEHELELRDRAMGPVLGVPALQMQLQKWTTQPLLVTAAFPGVEAKQALVTDLVRLCVEHRKGVLVNAWIARAVVGITVHKGANAHEHFGVNGTLRRLLCDPTCPRERFDAAFIKTVDAAALTGRVMMTSFRKYLTGSPGDALEKLRKEEANLVLPRGNAEGERLTATPCLAAVRKHMTRWAGVNAGLTATRACTYLPTPEVPGLDQFVDVNVDNTGAGTGTFLYVYLVQQARLNFRVVPEPEPVPEAKRARKHRRA